MDRERGVGMAFATICYYYNDRVVTFLVFNIINIDIIIYKVERG